MEERGLYPKYEVIKTETGEPIPDDFFILRPTRDPAAMVALAAYAVTTDNKTLAADIKQWVAGMLGGDSSGNM